MEELAESLQRLNEDDLLHVVQMIHDGKNGESYTKNDVEGSMLSHYANTPPSHYAGTQYSTPISTGRFGDPYSPLARKSAARPTRVRLGRDGQLEERDCNAQDYGFPEGIRANINPIAGEFHVDLYTLPDDLITNLWTFTEGRTN